jgi:hypothetical protein
MRIGIISLLACILVSDGISAQSPITDLHDEIDAARVRLVLAAGNGSSSGSAVTAVLVNETSALKRVDVNLARPIFLRNSGRGQNMVAVQVFLRDGGYTSDGRRAFIALRPSARTSVVFEAYCVDFAKDNPAETDRFTISSVPPDLVRVLANIRAHLSADPSADVVVPAQAAIWLAQGISMREIRERFDVSVAEERLARRFLH